MIFVAILLLIAGFVALVKLSLIHISTSSSMKTGVAIEAHLYSFIWAPSVFNICFVLSSYIYIRCV